MVGTMEKMLRQYGTSMTLIRDGEEIPVRAFLQETQSRSRDHMRRELSPVGQIAKGMYVYIGPASPQAEAGDLIVCAQRIYVVRRGETVMLGDRTMYCWGLCEEKGGEGQWGS